MTAQILSQNQLKTALHYNPTSGVFTWINSPRRGWIGKNAGCSRTGHGYITIRLNNKLHLAHRLAWLYVTGKWPAAQIDHRDHVRANNKWSNLREATNQENAKNSSVNKNNTSGGCGVWYHNQNKNWIAEIKVNYKKITLGSFANKHKAIAVRKAAEVMYDFHENHGRL